MSLEDEHGATQVIVWRSVRETQRKVLLESRLLAVEGRWQREGDVCNLIASKLADLSHLLGRLATESRDFRWTRMASMRHFKTEEPRVILLIFIRSFWFLRKLVGYR